MRDRLAPHRGALVGALDNPGGGSGMRPPRFWTALVAALSLVIAPIAGWPGTAAAQTTQTAAAQTAQLHGLRGDYYVSAPGTYDQFTTLKATVVDPNIDFNDLEPILDSLTGQNDHNTIRWTGQIQPLYSETYTFYMVGDNGFRLWVNDQLIIDHWVDDWGNPQTSTPIALQAGQKYDIKVEFFEDFGGSNLHLSWSSASQPRRSSPTPRSTCRRASPIPVRCRRPSRPTGARWRWRSTRRCKIFRPGRSRTSGFRSTAPTGRSRR